MNPFSANILIVIPNNQFDEGELLPVLDILKKAGLRICVLSKSGRESKGMLKTRLSPDGLLADWDRPAYTSGKYHAVVVMGGRGASKSLWVDPLLPQILTDHHRAGKIVGAIGMGVAVLARAGLLDGEAPGPDHPDFLEALSQANVDYSRDRIIQENGVITASGSEAADEFARTLIKALK